MAEPTSELTYTDLKKLVGEFMGQTYDSTLWTAAQSSEFDRIVQSGLRRFYMAHPWSFLWKKSTITTAADTKTYALPDDCDNVFGDLIYDPADNVMKERVVQDNDETLTSFAVTHNYNGKPERFSVQNTAISGTTSIRRQVYLWPTPDAEYTLHFEYRQGMNVLTGTQYPPGGSYIVEAIKAACLCEAEIKKRQQKGVYYEEWQEKLAYARRVEQEAQAGFVSREGDGLEVPPRYQRLWP